MLLFGDARNHDSLSSLVTLPFQLHDTLGIGHSAKDIQSSAEIPLTDVNESVSP